MKKERVFENKKRSQDTYLLLEMYFDTKERALFFENRTILICKKTKKVFPTLTIRTSFLAKEHVIVGK